MPRLAPRSLALWLAAGALIATTLPARVSADLIPATRPPIKGETLSPIVIDVAKNGFDLTSVEDGVRFDLDCDGRVERTAWTEAGSDDGLLAYDRDGNGYIDNGHELFGNHTDQWDRNAEMRNGIRALALFDFHEYGGNRDGVISREDAIYDQLRVWVDANHDGFSQPWELKTLGDRDVEAILLEEIYTDYRDEHGNWFKVAAPLRSISTPWRDWYAVDVFFRVGPDSK